MRPELLKLLESGFAAQQRGELASAEQCYRQVLDQDENNEFALNLMGVVHVRRQEYSKAADILERAVRVNPGDPETHNNLGLAYKGLNRFADAEYAFRSSLKINAAQAATQNNLGNVLAAVDRHAEAIGSFERALGYDPGFTDCLNNLAISLKELGKCDAAMAAIKRAITAEPSRSQFHNTLGDTLLREARYEEARESFKAAIGIDGNVTARVNLSTALKQLGETNESVQVLRSVLADEPGNAEAHHHLGVLLEQVGDPKGAAAEHRQALQHNPRLTSSYYQIAKLRHERLSGEELARVQELLEDASLLDVLRPSLYFALSCEYEKDEDYKRSIRLLEKAQAIKAERNPYNGSAVLAYLDACRRIFPLESASEAEQGADTPVPVFIVGMPRSGTTLTEQILSSHSAVEDAGEVGFIKELASRASAETGMDFPACVREIDDKLANELRSDYFSRMSDRCGAAPFVTDKNPLNYNFTGFIATLFPEAKIIYCKRDAMDNCVSIFRLPFDDNQGYSHDLAALGHFYREHERLMDFWIECFGDRVLTVHYEDTVDDVEQQARRMLDFIGADFESHVLRFFENRRTVLTPSAEQVRQPIYKTSVNAWRRYGEALTPLAEALGEPTSGQPRKA